MSFDLRKLKAKLDAIPAQFDGQAVKVGWFPSAKYEDGTQAAYVAAIQETGAPEVGIPPRPFMKPAVTQGMDEWTATARKGVKAVSEGRRTADQVFEVMGGVMKGAIQEQIAGDHTPLSDTTILLRKWKKEGKKITRKTVGQAAAAVAAGADLSGVATDPLRDTGLMIDSVDFTTGKLE